MLSNSLYILERSSSTKLPVYVVDLGLAFTLLFIILSFLVSNFIVTKMYIYRCKGKAFF